MPNQNSEKLLQQLFATIDAEQSMASLARFTTPSYVAHFPGHTEPLSLDDMTSLGAVFYSAFPGMRHDLGESVSDGSRGANQLTVRGVHTGPFARPAGTIPPTGRSLSLPVLNLFRFEAGKIAEQWAAFDCLSMYQQLGILLADGQAVSAA